MLSALIRRPVLACSLNCLILLFGVLAFSRLPMRQEPENHVNQIEVWTRFPGAHAEVVELQVTRRIEDALSGLDGIEKISSNTQDAESAIRLTFKPNYPLEKALNQVRDRVFSMAPSLPAEGNRPYIYEMSSDVYVTSIRFQDSTQSVVALSDWLRRHIEPELSLLTGVAQLEARGLGAYKVAVQLDPIRLFQHQVSAHDLIRTLKNEKPFASGGVIERGLKRQAIVIEAPPLVVSDLRELPILNHPELLRIKDVASVQLEAELPRIQARLDGQPSLLLAVIPKPSANPFEVVREVERYVARLKNTLPTHMSVEIVRDNTEPFKHTIQSVYWAILEAVVLVGLIMRLFLKSWRAALIPLLTVPLCLAGTCAVLYVLNFSLNPITLLAFVLAVGLVVDDAIVILENIMQHLEKGDLSPQLAAHRSLKEISFAVIGMTLTLAAVYLPVTLQQDATAYLFKEFAWTLAASVLISGFVALTLTPALGGLWLKSSLHRPQQQRTLFYQHLMMRCSRFKLTPLCLIIIVGLSVVIYQGLPQETMPKEDDDSIGGQIMSLNEPPVALSTLWDEGIELCSQQLPERRHLFLVKTRQGTFFQFLSQTRRYRNRDIFQIQEQFQSCLAQIPGAQIFTHAGRATLAQDESFKIILSHMGHYDQLNSAAAHLRQKLEEAQLPYLERVDTDESQLKPGLFVQLDRALANHFGVTLSALEEVVASFFGGAPAGDFYFDSYPYPIELRARLAARQDLSQINDYFVKSASGAQMPVGQFVTLEERLSQTQLKHFNRARSTTLRLELKPGANMDVVLSDIQALLKETLAPGIRSHLSGSAAHYQSAQWAMRLSLVLALLFIYLVLSALFESFIDPFIVLLTVPLSLLGALLGIKLLHGSNNVYSQIGLITLIGLISKHGILIVDTANRLVAEGMDLSRAAGFATFSRIRPIMMTSMAMFLGALPLIFSQGAYGFARQHIAAVIMGGLLSGTFFTVLLLPSFYVLIKGLRTQSK